MCVSLLMNEGYEGYGIFLAILEVLRDAPSYKYSSDPAVWSFLLHAEDTECVERVIKNYGLFDQDDNGLLYCPWLSMNLETYEGKKAKLIAAGKKGAAKRWSSAHVENGEAIATPLGENGEAIAYNNTQPNITLRNITKPSTEDKNGWREILSVDSPPVGDAFVEELCTRHQEGHAEAYVGQVCRKYSISEAVCNFILEQSNGADLTHPTYLKFVALCKRIEQEKWAPKLPANFFLTKLFED